MTTKDFAPGPLGRVEAEPAGDRWTLVFVRELAHPIGQVWAALTRPDQLARWAPFTADRNLDRTGPATLTMIDTEQPTETTATVRRAEEPTRLEYDWGGDRLDWELEPVGDGTRLTLRHTVADRETVAMVAAGWHLCLVVADHLLGGAPIEPIRGEDARNYGWADLRDAYQKELG